MGSSSSKSRQSQGLEVGSSSRNRQRRRHSTHLFSEDPLLSLKLETCYASLSKESIDEFLQREGSGVFLRTFCPASSLSLLPVWQINQELAMMERMYAMGKYDGVCVGARDDGICVGFRVRRRHISGSVADHLGSVNFEYQPYTLASDLDIMFELDLDVEFLGGSISKSALVAHPSTNHIGFFSVRFNALRSREYWLDEDALIAYSVREQFAEVARKAGYTNVTVNGPAITCQEENVRLSYDLVPCLRVAWPTNWLRDFQQRERPTGWPGPQLLEQLKGSLHLVAKSPYRGERQLWRVSFSRPESLLAQNLPPAAHFCLLMLRAARSALGAEASLIAPYHLKMCVFWLCERCAPEGWQQTVSAMCMVLDALRLFATAGFLPNFLRPSINVLVTPNATRRSRLYAQATHFRGRLQPVLEDLLDRFSRPWEQEMAGPRHHPPPPTAASSAGSQQRTMHSVVARLEESDPPPRDFLINYDVMEFVPNGILDAAMGSLPDVDVFVEDVRDTMEIFHADEKYYVDVVGLIPELEPHRLTWY